MRILLILICCAYLAGFNALARADDRLVRLAVPAEIVESGLLQYMLPRFSLKMQVKVQPVPPGTEAEAELGAEGVPVFTGAGATWALRLTQPDHPGAVKFAGWITSEVGQRAITGFTRDGAVVFTLPAEDTAEAEEITFEGNATAGEKLARAHCGRCHVSAVQDAGFGIGSTPSFFVLRGFADWSERFEAFYVLKPHPAFTQITEVTEPFPIDRPPPIVPIELTLDDLDAILAYVAALEPADLGAPLQHQ